LKPDRILALASAWALSWIGACGCTEASEAESYFWEPFVIYTTHGQFLDLDKEGDASPYVHHGIDIAACPDGQTKVLALESGYIVRTSFGMAELEGLTDYTYHNVILSSGEDRSQGILYAHLADCPWVLGEYVEAGQYLGSIVNFLPSGFEHLHLQVVKRMTTYGTGSDEAWGVIQEGDLGNPLVLLPSRLPAVLPESADNEPPQIYSRSPEGSPRVAFSFYADGPAGEEHTDPMQLCGALAIVAELQDQCSSGGSMNCARSTTPEVVASDLVAPLGFKLIVRTAEEPTQTVAEFALDLSTSADALPVDQIYHSGSSVGTYDERCLRFVLTYDPTNGCAWKPATAGDYVLQLTVIDAAGHETREPDFPIKVVSPSCSS
jgi:hypothetical protein